MMNFKKNIGSLDRAVRAALGVVAIFAFAMGMVKAPYSYFLLFIGVLLLFTAFLKVCLLYYPFKFSTNGKED
ncbi:hypothetical protein COU37_05375 [Candidatus Micrarchaeota archaeon CG10_big_fil_rev_8_21_14_0_10_45_29]|nr:MAG: hypothetical protein COU37_05375 [Candidatus Micrarchaeota archaeon CG10_big_fil_rev_8_21_14_0_10_45_29]